MIQTIHAIFTFQILNRKKLNKYLIKINKFFLLGKKQACKEIFN